MNKISGGFNLIADLLIFINMVHLPRPHSDHGHIS